MHYLCDCNAIAEGSSRGFELNGLSLFIVHYRGRFHAYRNSCPHRGIELNWQPDQFLTLDNELIQCATHGALFLIDNGRCVAGPCIHQSLQTLDITVINDAIWLI